MFFSLNKKIIYSISVFFLITAVLFVYTFYIVYGNKIQEEQRTNILRNQQYVNLLNENISYKRVIAEILDKNKDIHIPSSAKNYLPNKNNDESQLKEIDKVKKQIDELNEAYNQRYGIIQESVKIVIASTTLLVFSILLLMLLIRRWVLKPINSLSEVSDMITKGDLSMRVISKDTIIMRDELDNLTSTFNEMLDTIEKNIAEIKQKENFLQLLIDSIPDGIRVIDEQYNIILANKEYKKQIGKECGACMDKCYKSSQNLDYPCPKGTVTCPIQELKTSKKNSIRTVQQFAHFPNRHLDINASVLNTEDGNRYVVESIRDLSDEINFSHQQKLSSLGFLATSVAHEMKNHLGSIRIITERLLEKSRNNPNVEESYTKHLELVFEQLVACINVPERLLKLSKHNYEEGQSFNCVNSINEIISLLDYETKRKGCEVHFQSYNSNINISGNEADFKMMIMNLILNAINAIKENGEINIKISESSDGQTIISIQDNGSGIEKDNLHRIFEPFFSTRKNADKKGTGLGLAIVKSIIEKLGGTIEVSSTKDVGSIFSLKFPSNN